MNYCQSEFPEDSVLVEILRMYFTYKRIISVLINFIHVKAFLVVKTACYQFSNNREQLCHKLSAVIVKTQSSGSWMC